MPIDDIEKIRMEMMLRSRKFWLTPSNIKSNYETSRYLTALENLEKAATATIDSTMKTNVLSTLHKAIDYLKKVLKLRG